MTETAITLDGCLERLRQAGELADHILTCPLQYCSRCVEAAELFDGPAREFARYYVLRRRSLIYGLAQIAYGQAPDPAEFAKQVLVEANEWPVRRVS